MSVRRSSWIFGGLGIVLIVVAALVRFVFAPIMTRLPGDTNLGIDYTGTGTLLNSEALQKGDTAHALASNVPLTAARVMKVNSTDGGTAVLSDTMTINAGGQKMPSTHIYAVDRTTIDRKSVV